MQGIVITNKMTGNHNGFTTKIDILIVSAREYKHRIAVVRIFDCRLNTAEIGRLIIINGITHTNPAVSMEIELHPGDTLAVLPNVH